MKKYLRDCPEIFAELHPTKNDVNLFGKLTRASGRKVWWLCKKAGHEYEARVDHRTVSGSGCPFCSGRFATKDNNLAAAYPKIAASICSKNSPEADPSKITPKSSQKLWWRCVKDDRHVWQTTVSNRVRYPDSCPICSGHQVDETNSLSTLYPKLCDEWDYVKNAPLTPNQITSGTQRKVWWLCKKGHSYRSSVVGRTSRQRACPQCSSQSSKPEIRILTEMMFIFEDVKSRHRIEKLEVDIFIPGINVAIEFDGSYYHANKQKSDAQKGKMLGKLGIHLIRVRTKPLKKINDVDLIVEKESLQKHDLNNLVVSLERFSNPSSKEKIRAYLANNGFANEDLFRTYLSYFPSPFPEHSLEKKFPGISSEWNYEKNFPLTPKNFSAGSAESVWWICPKGHDYDMPIYVRAINRSNCPYCAGKRVDETNSLATLFPDLAKQFNNEKNYPLTPNHVTAGSGKIVWWTCAKGHNFESAIAERTGRRKGCPYCSKRKPSETNNLKKVYPWINEIWDHRKNSDKKPENFTPKSKKKVWLKCTKGHSYEKIVQNIKEGENCPYCLKVKPSAQYNLRVIHPKISQRWCAEKNTISTDEVLPSSGRKFWWECPKGHRYQRPVHTEVKSGRCPICKT